jgi:hypothetical protein
MISSLPWRERQIFQAQRKKNQRGGIDEKKVKKYFSFCFKKLNSWLYLCKDIDEMDIHQFKKDLRSNQTEAENRIWFF